MFLRAFLSHQLAFSSPSWGTLPPAAVFFVCLEKYTLNSFWILVTSTSESGNRRTKLCVYCFHGMLVFIIISMCIRYQTAFAILHFRLILMTLDWNVHQKMSTWSEWVAHTEDEPSFTFKTGFQQKLSHLVWDLTKGQPKNIYQGYGQVLRHWLQFLPLR